MKAEKGEFVVHCILCGKDFRAGGNAECGGLANGKPMCSTGDIRRELGARLPSLEVHLPQERECCGTFPGTHHRATCDKYRGKAWTPSNAKSEPTSAALSREVGSTDGLGILEAR